MGKQKLNFVSLEQIQSRSGRMSDHPLYNTWRGMVERCCSVCSTSYARYGKRGITVYAPWLNKERDSACKRWSKGFCLFLIYVANNLGERAEGFSLDRINTNLGYHPGNLRWANASLQKKNQIIKNKSGYKYVYSIAGSDKWQAEYKFKEKRFYVGAFKTKERAYIEALVHRLEVMWPENL